MDFIIFGSYFIIIFLLKYLLLVLIFTQSYLFTPFIQKDRNIVSEIFWIGFLFGVYFLLPSYFATTFPLAFPTYYYFLLFYQVTLKIGLCQFSHLFCHIFYKLKSENFLPTLAIYKHLPVWFDLICFILFAICCCLACGLSMRRASSSTFSETSRYDSVIFSGRVVLASSLLFFARNPFLM